MYVGLLCCRSRRKTAAQLSLTVQLTLSHAPPAPPRPVPGRWQRTGWGTAPGVRAAPQRVRSRLSSSNRCHPLPQRQGSPTTCCQTYHIKASLMGGYSYTLTVCVCARLCVFVCVFARLSVYFHLCACICVCVCRGVDKCFKTLAKLASS
jgi:hypothetical protein